MEDRTDRDRDLSAVTRLLGREPSCAFEVVVRRPNGEPVVIRNSPFLFDGTPMPTMFWLCDADLNRRVSRLEADGGVRRAELEVPADAVADAHRRYSQLRDALVDGEPTSGPRPSGGVAGTRTGVKCLHAHLAWHLAGGDDPVGRWVEENLDR